MSDGKQLEINRKKLPTAHYVDLMVLKPIRISFVAYSLALLR